MAIKNCLDCGAAIDCSNNRKRCIKCAKLHNNVINPRARREKTKNDFCSGMREKFGFPPAKIDGRAGKTRIPKYIQCYPLSDK